MKSFSDKVREARISLNLNQETLGKLVGVSKRAIAAYETDGTRPRAKTLAKLAEALQVSVDYLTNDDITDPQYGIEKERYGAKAAREIDFLMERNVALFAGGEVPQEAKDAYFEAVLQAYMSSKEEARAKFGHKKS